MSTVSGFGSDPRIYYRFELENGFQISGRTDLSGGLQNVVLSPNATYRAVFYSPLTNRWTSFVGRSAPTGGSFRFENRAGIATASGFSMVPSFLYLNEFGGVDVDRDGIPDIGEFAIGTNPNSVDSDGDGVRDDAEITQGLDPFDNRPFPTGVISSLPLRGEAREVVAIGSTVNAEQLTAYIATGSYGLAVVDALRFNNPIVRGQLDLSGDATDVAVDPNLQIAVVAANSGGLHFVNVADPMVPALVHTLSVSASQVEVIDGVAYVAVGPGLRAYDLLTGQLLQTLPLGTGALNGLAREGNFLYTMDADRVLRAIDVSGPDMVARGSLTLPHGAGKLFVGNGIAYAAAINSYFRGGFATANVSNPDALTLISGSDVITPFVASGTAIVANGAGLGILIGTPLFSDSHVLDVMDVSNPADTNVFLTRVALPAAPSSVTLAGGIAFVAGGTAGLQVVNYRAFDSLGQAPTVTLTSPAVDLDPATPGTQVTEGRSIPIRAEVRDDVQVRNVELLVNGRVVRNAVSFPFDLSAIALSTDPSAPAAMVQVRATDTGGNPALSNVLVFDLVPDTFAPTIIRTTPADGATRNRGLQRVEVIFSEPLAAASVTTDTFRLRDSGGQVIAPLNLQLRSDDRLVQLTYAPLPEGTYRLVLDGPAVTDRVGNPLGTGDVVSTFTLTNIQNTWTNSSGGAWENPANWSLGQMPSLNDNVLITTPGAYTITINSDVSIASLTLGAVSGTQTLASSRNLALEGQSVVNANGVANLSGSMVSVNETLTINGRLTRSGGTIDGSGVLSVGASGMLTLAGSIINAALDNRGTLEVVSTGNTINGALSNAVGATLRVQSYEVFFGSATLTVAQGFSNAGTIELTQSNGVSPLTATLAVTAGTLTNLPGGVIRSTVSAGSGGFRALNAQLDNQGTLDVSYPLGLDRPSAAHTNSGTINVSGGNLTVAQANASLSNSGGIDISAGRTVSIAGSYSQTAAGNLTVQLASASSFGRLAVTGAAALNGTLTVTLTGGFVPSTGSSFPVLTAGSRSGTFATITPPAGVSFNPMYSATGLTLVTQLLRVAGTPSGTPGDVLTPEAIAPLVGEAITRWTAVFGGAVLDLLTRVEVQIADLPDGFLGFASPSVILIDDDASGFGWFLDDTPWDDEDLAWIDGELRAREDGPAAGRIDLLTVIAHELGHVLGLEDADHGLPAAILGFGVRRVPGAMTLRPELDWVFRSAAWLEEEI